MIEALRQPLESGDVTIARQEESITLPARGMVVLACNPCPCGNYSVDPRASRCNCRAPQLRDYRAKVTGPVADRVDIVRNLTPLTKADRGDRLIVPETSSAIRERVTAARARQAERYAGESWGLNGHAPGPVLRERWPLSDAGQRLIDDKVYDGKLSRRGATRVHRLAWTVADLRHVDGPGVAEVAVALLLRTGGPLMIHMLERAS